MGKKRWPAAPRSGRGHDSGRPSHPRPTAVRFCWAGYRWCPSTGLSRGDVVEAGGPEREAGRGRAGGGDRGAANGSTAHQLTAFAPTRCTPAAGSTKRGAPRRRQLAGEPSEARARACSALRAGRRGPPASVPAAASARWHL